MSVIHEMMEEGDYSFEDDFSKIALKIAKDNNFPTDEDKRREFVRLTGVNHWIKYKPIGNLRRTLS